MRMPFGKWEGYEIGEIPLDYLRWLSRQPWLQEPLKSEVNYAFEYKNKDYTYNRSNPKQYAGIEPREIFIEIIRAGYRELVKKHHPDIGGDTRKMMEINKGYEELTNIFRKQ